MGSKDQIKDSKVQLDKDQLDHLLKLDVDWCHTCARFFFVVAAPLLVAVSWFFLWFHVVILEEVHLTTRNRKGLAIGYPLLAFVTMLSCFLLIKAHTERVFNCWQERQNLDCLWISSKRSCIDQKYKIQYGFATRRLVAFIVINLLPYLSLGIIVGGAASIFLCLLVGFSINGIACYELFAMRLACDDATWEMIFGKGKRKNGLKGTGSDQLV